MSNNVAVAQWIKFSAGELKDLSLIPGQGEFFSLKLTTATRVNPWSLAINLAKTNQIIT